MAWSRTGLKGMNADDPTSNVKQGPGTHISETGIIVNIANKKTYPGAINFKDMSDIEFDGAFDIGARWNTDDISKWFRDDGSTTT